MQWAHFCRECHISFSFSFSIYSISMCNFRPFLGLSLHFKVCRRKDAQTNSKKTNLLKSFFFSTFFFILLDGIVFSLVHVFEMYPVFLRVISGWYSLFMFHFWLKKINYCLCVGRKLQMWLLSGHAEQLVSVLFAIPFHNAIFVWLL